MCSGIGRYSATLEYHLDLHCHSVGSSWHSQSTAYPFTPEHHVVFEAVVFRRANIDEEFAQRAAAMERLFLSLKVPREASSLKLLREKVGLRPWTRTQGRPLP